MTDDLRAALDRISRINDRDFNAAQAIARTALRAYDAALSQSSETSDRATWNRAIRKVLRSYGWTDAAAKALVGEVHAAILAAKDSPKEPTDD